MLRPATATHRIISIPALFIRVESRDGPEVVGGDVLTTGIGASGLNKALLPQRATKRCLSALRWMERRQKESTVNRRSGRMRQASLSTGLQRVFDGRQLLKGILVTHYTGPALALEGPKQRIEAARKSISGSC